MKTELLNSISRSFHKTGLKLKKHSPEILMVAGIAGIVTSAVMACKATTKVNDILTDTKEQITKVHEVLENENITQEEYSEEDSKKDLALIYTQTGIKFVKLYGPAVLLGAASITAILASNNILRKRSAALAAAYATVDRGFKEYRERVVERFGKELDKELKYNIRSKTVEETTIDEDGKETTTTTTIDTVDRKINEHSDFARFFDEACPDWVKNAECNLTFVRRQEEWANRKLQQNGYLFLNEVYEMLGIPRTKAGQIVGWVYNPKDPAYRGDEYVDFGIYDYYKLSDAESARKRAFVNGHERVILLDFNVVNILDFI